MAAWLTLLFVVLAGTAMAETWRWTDPDGRVHFSDTPPPEGMDAETVELHAPDGAKVDEEVRRRQERALEILDAEAEARRRRRQEEARRREAEQQQRCNEKRRELIEEENSGPLLTRDFPGVRYRQQKAKERRIEELRQWIKENC